MECVIVKPADAEPLEERAATELARYARMMLGRAPRIVTDDETAPPRPTTHFLVGAPERNRLTRRFLDEGRLRMLRELPVHPDGFVVAGDESDTAPLVALAGRWPIGTLYAVYEYLERACGRRKHRFCRTASL
jgi:hypothetical protein